MLEKKEKWILGKARSLKLAWWLILSLLLATPLPLCKWSNDKWKKPQTEKSDSRIPTKSIEVTKRDTIGKTVFVWPERQIEEVKDSLASILELYDQRFDLQYPYILLAQSDTLEPEVEANTSGNHIYFNKSKSNNSTILYDIFRHELTHTRHTDYKNISSVDYLKLSKDKISRFGGLNIFYETPYWEQTVIGREEWLAEYIATLQNPNYNASNDERYRAWYAMVKYIIEEDLVSIEDVLGFQQESDIEALSQKLFWFSDCGPLWLEFMTDFANQMRTYATKYPDASNEELYICAQKIYENICLSIDEYWETNKILLSTYYPKIKKR